MERSAAVKRITTRMRFNWMEQAVANSRKIRYAKDATDQQRATYELNYVLGLVLEIVEDPECRGGMDLGRMYVERRVQQYQRQNAGNKSWATGDTGNR